MVILPYTFLVASPIRRVWRETERASFTFDVIGPNCVRVQYCATRCPLPRLEEPVTAWLYYTVAWQNSVIWWS